MKSKIFMFVVPWWLLSLYKEDCSFFIVYKKLVDKV